MFVVKGLNDLAAAGRILRLSRLSLGLPAGVPNFNQRACHGPQSQTGLCHKQFCCWSKTTKQLISLSVINFGGNTSNLINESRPRPNKNGFNSAQIRTIHRQSYSRPMCSLLTISPRHNLRNSGEYQFWCRPAGLGLHLFQISPVGLGLRLSSSSTKSTTFEKVAKLISDSPNILIMTGAGISTPSGIPDFRSPGTGLYDNLQKYHLPYPEAIFDIHYFMMDPQPFFTLARDLYPGVNYKPNGIHYFLRLLCEKEKLQKLYTQNIDGLERIAGIPDDKLMEAHGTFSTASCTLCGKSHSAEKVKEAIRNGDVPMCEGSRCKGKVKPDIVFFGENLPAHFWNFKDETHLTDLLIVIGTSLEVYPFAGIAESFGRSTPRVLINREAVGSFGTRVNDIMLLGDLEDSIKQLAEALGWEKSLESLTQES